MMCKECLYCKVCPLILIEKPGGKTCSNFKDRSRFIELPCVVGDTVYNKAVEPFKVISIEWFSKKVTHLHCVSPVTGWRQSFSIGKRSLGKTVFLTREEAEEALKERKPDVTDINVGNKLKDRIMRTFLGGNE